MLFWLGTIELETPTGRFILTADSVIRLPRRRRATKEEAAQIWPALEARLMYASYDELLPWYELYWELTSERFYGYGHGPGSEPRVSNLLRTIEFALRSEQLHLERQEPFDPLPELEWEPPPKLRPKGPPAQTPSELWKSKSATETFIGIRLKDQNGDPVTNSRVRVKLPDGSTKEGATNSEGELEITGLSQDGPADITLLDHAKPGKAEAPEWPEEKEFKVTVVDEIGNPLSGIWLYFRHGSASNLVVTDDSGVACYKTSNADTVSVTFESPDALAQVMKPIWTDCRGKARKEWVQQDDSATNVTLLAATSSKRSPMTPPPAPPDPRKRWSRSLAFK